MLPDLFRIKMPSSARGLSKKVQIKKHWQSVYLPASCAIAGIMETDTMFTGATEVNKETMHKFPYSRYPSMIGVFFHLNYKKLGLDPLAVKHISQTCFQQTQVKKAQLTLSSVVTSTRPFHLYRDAMLANRAGVKKFTFWVLLMALFSMTYDKKKINVCQIQRFV